LSIGTNKKCPDKQQIRLHFSLSQNSLGGGGAHHKLLESLVNYLACGYIYNYSSRSAVSFHVTKLQDVLGIIIPFFSKYPLHGVKHADFLDFCKVANLLANRSTASDPAFSSDTVAQIRLIKSGMNAQRVYEVPEDTLNVVRGSDTNRKRIYLYDANTLELIKIFAMQRELRGMFFPRFQYIYMSIYIMKTK